MGTLQLKTQVKVRKIGKLESLLNTSINFKCKKCNNDFDCEVGKIYFPSSMDERLSFEKNITCPNCGAVKVDEVELTELGQTQISELFFTEKVE